METLESTFKITAEVVLEPNLCSYFTDRDLSEIGRWVSDNYERDCASRVDWVARNQTSMNLAMQVQKQKTFPWPDCSNITFPLVTIAALQFSARAYPAIVNGRNVVSARVIGEDPTGIANKVATKIGRHMSWQLLEQDENWEEGQDRALVSTAITGISWKKTYQCGTLRHPVSEFVFCQDLVLDYWAKSVETCAVKTHIIPMYRNDIRERMLRGTFCDYTAAPWFTGPAQVSLDTTEKDNRSGLSVPQANSNTPFILLEQHCWLDLDCDGYAEPYIITIEKETAKVLRIVTRFDRMEDVEFTQSGEIVRIKATEYFTKVPFIPSPDGSIMDIGFGTLLGPLNESVNAAINQLFDAATLSITAGGFLGRGAKIRGGTYSFKPFDWQRVDSPGDDLRKSIVPLPVREPSGVMFQLLGLLIEYSNRIAGATDMMAGENPGQNTPAQTANSMVEQGQKIYSAIFKRIWRSMKQEFKKLKNINAVYLPARQDFGDGEFIYREDYTLAVFVVPVADPTITSDGAKYAKARLLREAAASAAGYNRDEVEKLYLKSLGFDQIEAIFPGTANSEPPPPDIKLQIQQLKNENAAADRELKELTLASSMQETIKLNEAKIILLTAQTEKLLVEADEAPNQNRINAFRASIEAMRERNSQLNADADRILEGLTNERDTADRSRGNVSGMEVPPDDTTTIPMVRNPPGVIEGELG